MLTDSTAIPLAPAFAAKRDPAAEALTESEVISFVTLLGLIFQSRGDTKTAKIIRTLVLPDLITAWPRYLDAIYGPLTVKAEQEFDMVATVLEWIKSGGDIAL